MRLKNSCTFKSLPDIFEAASGHPKLVLDYPFYPRTMTRNLTETDGIMWKIFPS